jgi:hypothetical protein
MMEEPSTMTSPRGQTMRERYGDEPMQTDAADPCPHTQARLMFVHPALDEWYCFDCSNRVRVWSPSP